MSSVNSAGDGTAFFQQMQKNFGELEEELQNQKKAQRKRADEEISDIEARYKKGMARAEERMTHTIEVQQVARTIARALNLNTGTQSERAAAVQEIAKQVAQQAQGAGTDLGRIMSTEGSVEATKNPMANRAIMAQAYAKLDHDRARYNFFKERLDADRTADPATLQMEFEKVYPREKLYEQRFNQLALPGATPYTENGQLNWNELKPGASYLIMPKEWWRMSGGENISQPKRMKVVVINGKKQMVRPTHPLTVPLKLTLSPAGRPHRRARVRDRAQKGTRRPACR